MHLSALTLASLPADIHTPIYDRRRHAPGVVHLGLGAFHRAHQALVFDRLLASGDTRWGIHGVGMTRPDLVNHLRAQDGLYAVRVADGQGVKWQVPGALWRTSVATTERHDVVQAIAAPSTRWVTLTVTEKGYTPALAQLLLDGLRLRQQRQTFWLMRARLSKDHTVTLTGGRKRPNRILAKDLRHVLHRHIKTGMATK